MRALSYRRPSGGHWIVAEGQHVACGDVLAAGPVPLHAARSGRISALSGDIARLESSGEPTEPWAPLASSDPSLVMARIRDAGIVGLGGGGYPTHAKLVAAKRRGASKLLINAVECEAGISCDAALCQQDLVTIERGVRVLARLLDAEAHVVTSSPTRAAGHIDGVIHHAYEAVSTPAGAERVLCKRLFDLTLRADEYPVDHGVVVVNLGTAHAIARAIAGWPLIERMVSIGDDNQWLAIGTPVADLLPGTTCREGGLLSGRPLAPPFAVSKVTNALHPAPQLAEQPCIRCGACDEACPAELPVTELVAATGDLASLQRLRADECIECGLCNPVCPSDIAVLDRLRAARQAVTLARRQADAAQSAQARYHIHQARADAQAAAKAQRRAERLRRLNRG